MQPAASKPTLICLMGPTASGKTALAIELAGALGAELISVDSALVYRGLDIGSAKPEYPHHLVDIRDPSEVYSAADFVADVSRLALEITARGKIPLLVGGTMMYFKAYLEGLAAMPPANPVVRAGIEELAASEGWPRVHAELARVDAEAAARIHPHHSQRLGRALEVYRSSGVPMSTWQRQQPRLALPSEHYNVIQLVICPLERAVLHQRIALRFEQMLADGFVEEVRHLHQRGDLAPDLPAIRAVGYRQLWQYLEGHCSLEQATADGIAATRQLAKRQLTWLRKWPQLYWLLTDAAGNVPRASGSDPLHQPAVEKPLPLALNYIGLSPM